jgi:hypothetical protein
MSTRQLLDEERKVLEFLVTNSNIANKDDIQEWIENCKCEELSDGDMGSIRLIRIGKNNPPSQFSYTGVESEFTDTDGISVIISLNISNDGYPFELDFWKVNFAPLIAYPKPTDLKLIGRQA